VVLQPGTDVWTLSTLLASKHAELAALGELVDVGPCVRVSLHDSSIRRLEEAIEKYLPPLSPHSSLVP
jgi:hypothetical protein